MKIKPKSIALLGICAAIAMVLSYIESLIPLSFAVPGIKLGLANIAVIFALYKLGAGAALSLTAMILLKRWDRFSTVGVSVIGGILHNTSQILVAMLIMETAQIVYYLPILCVSGIAAGVAVGIVSAILVKRVPVSKE